MLQDYAGGRIYDMITGERVERGDRILDTEIMSRVYNPIRNNRTMFIKESTIVWLAEKAGLRICNGDACKCNDGDSGNAENVDGEDVSGRGGAVKAGKVKARGRKSAS